jgi:hypothetical protein
MNYSYVAEKNYQAINPDEFGYETCKSGHFWGPGIRTHWLLHFVVSGEGIYQTEGNTYHLKAGQMFVAKPYTQIFYQADAENPSATSLRSRITENKNWLQYTPWEAHTVFENAAVHSITYGERAMLSRLRTMSDAEFEALPFGSEGLWRKLMHASRSQRTLEDILVETKSKRYTRSRLDRMVMCAFLGLTKEMMMQAAPYVRVLGFSDRGISALKLARQTGPFPHIGEKTGDAYEGLERRCDDLYGLFCAGAPEAAGLTDGRRVCIERTGKAD